MNKYKELLKKEKLNLETELATLGHKNAMGDWEAVGEEEGGRGDGDAGRAESGDAADQIEAYENNVAIVNQLEKSLAEVNLALGKIENPEKNGQYGVCSVCGEKIEEDRLEASPAASTCKLHM